MYKGRSVVLLPALLVLLVAFSGFLANVEALKCQVCNSEECETQRGYRTEDCPTGVKFCYSLKSERGNVYRAACAFTDCSRIQMSRNSECAVCDSDNCNGLKSQLGHGDSFDKNLESSESAEVVESSGRRPMNQISNGISKATLSLIFLAPIVWLFGQH